MRARAGRRAAHGEPDRWRARGELSQQGRVGEIGVVLDLQRADRRRGWAAWVSGMGRRRRSLGGASGGSLSLAAACLHHRRSDAQVGRRKKRAQSVGADVAEADRADETSRVQFLHHSPSGAQPGGRPRARNRWEANGPQGLCGCSGWRTCDCLVCGTLLTEAVSSPSGTQAVEATLGNRCARKRASAPGTGQGSSSEGQRASCDKRRAAPDGRTR